MSLNRVLFSSAKSTHTTPQLLFDRLNDEFRFDLDAAATHENAKCQQYFGPDHKFPEWRDALRMRAWSDYGTSIWCNPPYPVKKEWIRMAEQVPQELPGARCVMLVPARTDTGWWTEATQMANEIRFLVGRLKFGDEVNSAPFPSVLLIWGKPRFCVTQGQVVGWWDYRDE